MPPGGPGGVSPDSGTPVPGPSALPDRTVRIGLSVNAAELSLGGGGPLRVSGPDGAYLGDILAGDVRRIVPVAAGLVIQTPGGTRTGAYASLQVVPADSAALLRVNGRDYRGALTLYRDRGGVTAINAIFLETYLASVVSSELGRRDPSDLEAVRAQAVVSRTFARRKQGYNTAAAYDLVATVADQVYGGVANETPLGWAAVQDTRGEVLTYGGGLADTFFFSTCGGRTADGTEAFRAADRPYLRSIDDSDGGVPFCSISPRYRWHEEWTGEQLRGILARTLPPVAGTPAGALRQLHDVRITGRSGSGRASGLAVAYAGGEARVDGSRIRDVLRTNAGDILRSTAFTLTVTRTGGRVTRVAADGGGAGHGVGMCQWGAVGRARAGQSYRQILSAYFPGTSLERQS